MAGNMFNLGNNNSGGGAYPGFGTPIQGNMNMPYQGGWQPTGGYSGAGTPGYNNELSSAASRPASAANGPQADSAESTALSYLTGVVGGTNTPFDQNTQNNMFSQASNMNATAEGAQNQAIQSAATRGGASANDPSAQLAQRQSMAQRQGANQQALGQIQSQANIANQRTQQQAAGSLLNHADERYAIQNGNNQRMAQMALGYLGGSGGGGQQQHGSSSGQINLGGDLETNSAMGTWGSGGGATARPAASRPSAAQQYNAYMDAQRQQVNNPNGRIPRPDANGNYSMFDG